jgi:hypothetical protein
MSTAWNTLTDKLRELEDLFLDFYRVPAHELERDREEVAADGR